MDEEQEYTRQNVEEPTRDKKQIINCCYGNAKHNIPRNTYGLSKIHMNCRRTLKSIIYNVGYKPPIRQTQYQYYPNRSTQI